MSVKDAMSGAPNLGEPLPWLVTAGQPSAEQFAAARDAGLEVVIDLRDPMEPRPFDEAATVAALGLAYINIPVNPGSLDTPTLERISAALRAHSGKSSLLHCASANRVGGALIPYLILDEKMAEDAAVQVAMQVGLRSAGLMEWGLAYAKAQG
jgi:protein tyrosine phosphatase (PTP) superfamily phosphohydrolase (DUF442 family)